MNYEELKYSLIQKIISKTFTIEQLSLINEKLVDIEIKDTTKKGIVEGYTVIGGGFGHGVGMSQNGANRMAEAGFSCDEILQKFFPGTILVSYEDNS